MIIRSAVDAHVNESAPSTNYARAARMTLNGAAGSNDKQAHIRFGRKPPLGAKILSAILRVRLNGAWSGSQTITAKRITSSWSEANLKWSNKPTVVGTNEASEVIVDGVNQQVVEFDLTAMYQDAANGSALTGIRLELSTDSNRFISSSEHPDATLRPELEIEWSEAPEVPDRLAPDGADAISVQHPVLAWRFTDKLGTGPGTKQASSQVQIDDNSDFASVEYDSGKVTNTESQWDLRRNLLTKNQSDVETDTTGLAAIANASIARVTSQFQQGVASLQVTASAGGNVDAGQSSGSRSPVTEGRDYTGSIYFRNNTTTRNVLVIIEWYNSGGASIGSSTGTAVAESAGVWTRASVTAEAPAGAVTARIFGRIQSAAGSEIHFMDALQLSDSAELPLWSPGYVGLSDGVTRYWRVRVWDGTDFISEWSPAAEFTRDNLGTLSISNPAGATVPETTPPFIWSLTGETQARYRVRLLEVSSTGELTELWEESGTGTDNSATPPAGLIDSLGEYRVVVQVWDTKARTAEDHVTASRDFTYVRDGTPAAVTGLTAVPQTGSPAVLLTFQRASAPDFFCLVVDGKEVVQEIDPGEAFVSGTTYEYIYWGATPRVEHDYEVEAVVQTGGGGNPFQHSDGNSTVSDVMTQPLGMWLVDEEDNTAIQLMGKDTMDWEIGETGTTYTVVGSPTPVRITDQVRGYQGTVSGQLVGLTERGNFLELKSRRKSLTLVVGDVAIPIRLEESSLTPTSMPGEPIFNASFAFFQSGPPWPVVK